MDDASSPPSDDLPELTRSLRSFGSRRPSREVDGASDDQERFFAPLLQARRRAAAAATRAEIASSFEPRQLIAELDETLRAFASARFDARPPARRAFEAELFEIVEPLRRALQHLEERMIGVTASAAAVDDDQWKEWLAVLRATFRVADDSWPPLRAALAAAPHRPTTRLRGWRPSRPGGDAP